MAKEWLTISEAAKEIGVTPQAIYKRLKTTLYPFYKQVDGRKLLHRDALEVIRSGGVEPQAPKVEAALNIEMLHLMRQDIETIKDQLTQKDRQISALLEELAAKNDQIKALNEGLNQAITTAGQAQYMLNRALIEPAQDTPGEAAQDASEPMKQDPPQEEPTEETPEDPPIKKTFWQKILRR